MQTFNIEANMNAQAQFGAGTLPLTPPTVREVLECGSPLPLSVDAGPFQSGRGLPHQKLAHAWDRSRTRKRLDQT